MKKKQKKSYFQKKEPRPKSGWEHHEQAITSLRDWTRREIELLKQDIEREKSEKLQSALTELEEDLASVEVHFNNVFGQLLRPVEKLVALELNSKHVVFKKQEEKQEEEGEDELQHES